MDTRHISTFHKLIPVKGMEGIAQCERCKCAEGTLPTECPLVPVDQTRQEDIMAGRIDYVGGYWCKPYRGSR